MQLVAYGAQDVYMTSDPQITFWKRAYKRHTNFSLESIGQTFQGSVDFSKKASCQISRNGDLIHNAYLQVKLPTLQEETDDGKPIDRTKFWLPWIGHAIIDYVEVSIGGQVIDKHTGDWLHIWNELSGKNLAGYEKIAGKYLEYNDDNILYIPLQFWFNRSPGMALPLIALQYHEVRVTFQFNSLDKCIDTEYVASLGSRKAKEYFVDSFEAELFVDFVYIDTEERRRFAQTSHEYLIQQVQFTGDEAVNSSTSHETNNKINLNFNHPCKELIWVVKSNDHKNPFNYVFNEKKKSYKVSKADEHIEGLFDHINALDDKDELAGVDDIIMDAPTAGSVDGGSGGHNTFTHYAEKGPLKSAYIQLNGHKRIAERPGSYFNLIQPYQHHSNVPRSKGIYCYSFALEPESEQPTGSCNMSRIDHAVLHLTLQKNHSEMVDGCVGTGADRKTHNLKVFATNFNVLRIMGGMGGLAFAN